MRQSMVEPAPDTAAALAAELKVDTDLVREWRDLYRPVPAKTVEQIAAVVDEDPNTLFDSQFDRLGERQFATPQFQQAIVKKYAPGAVNDSDAFAHAVDQFAREMDVRREYVEGWLTGDKPVFPPTSAAAADRLDEPVDKLFKKAA